MDPEKQGAVTQTPVTTGSESSQQDAAVAGEVGYVPENNRESDFFTRNGLNLRSFGRRKSFYDPSVINTQTTANTSR